MIQIKNFLSILNSFYQLLLKIDFLKNHMNPKNFIEYVDKNQKKIEIPKEFDFKEEIKKLEEIQESLSNKVKSIIRSVKI